MALGHRIRHYNSIIERLAIIQHTADKTLLARPFSFQRVLQKSALLLLFTCGMGVLSFSGT